MPSFRLPKNQELKLLYRPSNCSFLRKCWADSPATSPAGSWASALVSHKLARAFLLLIASCAATRPGWIATCLAGIHDGGADTRRGSPAVEELQAMVE